MGQQIRTGDEILQKKKTINQVLKTEVRKYVKMIMQ